MADDHNVMRIGLRMLLDAEQDMEEDPIFIREAMSAGAHSYVLKHSAGPKLVRAIRAAAQGSPKA